MQARYLETAERIVFCLDDFLFDSQIVELLCGEFLDTVLPFDCDRSVNRDVRVVALMVLLYAGFTQVRKW